MNERSDRFVEALLDPAQDIPKGLTSTSGSSQKRFAVYRNNVAVSLTEALETAFPRLRILLGNEFFTAMAGVYLRAHPPASPLLAEFGSFMPAFLEGFAPVARYPYLADVARIEIALRESYHAADSRSIPLDGIATLPPAELPAVKFSIAPSMRMVRSQYPIYTIWSRSRQGGKLTESAAQSVIISRFRFDPEVDLLPQGADIFLEAATQGKRMSEAVAMAFGSFPDFSLDKTLALILRRGVITGIA